MITDESSLAHPILADKKTNVLNSTVLLYINCNAKGIQTRALVGLTATDITITTSALASCLLLQQTKIMNIKMKLYPRIFCSLKWPII